MATATRRWTREEVLELTAQNPSNTPRYEVVDGVLLVTPAPSNRHQRSVEAMFARLYVYLGSQPAAGRVCLSPSDVMPEPGTKVEPDLYIVPLAEARRTLEKYPVRDLLLTIEVLSPGDRSGDRTRKRALYQRTVPEYWIVNHDDRQVEVWSPTATAPVIQRERVEWHPAGASTPFVLDVVAYFAEVYGETY